MGSRTPHQPPSLRAAAIACVVLCVGFVVVLSCLTRGFEVWTLDDRRSDEVAVGKLVAPPVLLREALGNRFSPWGQATGSDPVYLVDFIYTRCETICIALGSEFYRLQQRILTLGLEDRVRLLSISIDPSYDEAPRLAAYGVRQRANPAIWQISAPASPEALKVLLRSLDVVVIPDGLGGYVHNGEIHLIDGGGTVLGLFDFTAFDQALEAARAKR